MTHYRQKSGGIAGLAEKEYKAGVTVVIPLYNRADLISRAMDSVYAQNVRPLNLIVVDNNSTDDGYGVVERWMKEHEDLHFGCQLISQPEPGAAAARQMGLMNVDTEFVMFLDSDDAYRPDALEKLLDKQSEDDYDIVVGGVNAGNISFNHRLQKSVLGNMVERHLVSSLLCTVSWMGKTEFVRSAGGWNKSVRVWDDYELGVRLLLSNPRIAEIDNVIADVYFQEESITGLDFHSKSGKWEHALDECEKSVRRIESPLRDRFLRWLTYRRVILAALYKKEGYPELAYPLLSNAIGGSGLDSFDRMRLRFIFRFTSLGGRAAYLLWKGLGYVPSKRL